MGQPWNPGGGLDSHNLGFLGQGGCLNTSTSTSKERCVSRMCLMLGNYSSESQCLSGFIQLSEDGEGEQLGAGGFSWWL